MRKLHLLLFVLYSTYGFSQTEEINNFIDQWHLAAAAAKSGDFFNRMSDSSIYIGTDAKERWTKAEFMAFAKPYFDKGTA